MNSKTLRASLTWLLSLVGLIGLGIVVFSTPKLEQVPPRLLPVPGQGGENEAENLGLLELYWNDRLTFPTGEFDAAWVRQAAAQDALVASGVPAGAQRPQQEGALALSTTSFTALGPMPERMTGCTGCYDYGTTAGRINDIVVDPTTTTNGSIVAYSAGVGGGVWKTSNCCTASTTWFPTTDDPLLATISIDTLALDPNDHNTIYAGTGDLNYGSFSMGSQGILKSTDAGSTWTLLGADVFTMFLPQPAGYFGQYQAVGKVRVDPRNSNIVVAGAKTGLYLSYDGGQNWTGPCLTNNYTSMRQDITGLVLTDMGSYTRIIAAVGVRGFATTVQYNLDQNGANGIYRGTVPASGCPVDFVSIASNANGFVFGTSVTGSPYSTGANMNAGSGSIYVNTTTGNQLGRIDIAVAPSNPNYIYAQVGSIAANSASGCGNASGCQLGAWATTDGGATWSFMAGSAGGSLRACSGATGSGTAGGGDYSQNWYDQGVAVDPNNPDRVFFDTFEVWLANRTGSTWYNLTCGYNGTSVANHVVHVDQHALAFVPGSSSILLAGNDGGVHGTANANAAAEATLRPTWFNMDVGFNTIEFYSGDISGNFANSSSPAAAGGAQDNGPSSVTFAGGAISATQWQMGLGGDGFYARIDPVGLVSQAQGTITLVTGGATAGQTFQIGSQTFTFVAARTTTGEVTLASSTTTEGNNIVTAITADLAGVVTAARSGATVVVTAVSPGAAGNAIIFVNNNAANFSMNGSGTLGGTTVGGVANLRIFEGNNSGGMSRCVNNCTTGGATWSSVRGSWTADTQSFVLPFDIFHGGIPGGDDCPAAGVPGGCGHLIAGTTRVWETVAGGNATMNSASWYVTNFTSTQNMTKQTLGNRSFINQVKYSPKYQSVAIVGTNDANVWIGFNLGTGTAGQANWVDVTSGNTVLPLRPVLGVALDPSVPAANVPVGYVGVGGFDENTPTMPGHVFQVTCTANCASVTWLDKSGNLPNIPVDSIIVNPNYPQQVFAGTDWGLYFTNDVTAASPVWYRFDSGLPHAMIWDMQIDRGATTLSVWTRGRGAFVYPLPSNGITLPATVSISNLNQTFDGTPKSISATTNPIGLDVLFAYDGSSTPPTNAGVYTVTATVNDVTYQGITSDTLTIAKANTVASVTSTPNASAYHQVVTFTAVVTSAASVAPDGSVTLYDDGVYVGNGTLNASGVATITTSSLTIGIHPTMTVSYNGSGNFNGSESDSYLQTVGQNAASLILNGLTQTYDGLPKPVTVTTTPGGLSVTVTYDGSPIAPTNAGAYGVTATISDTNYVGMITGTLTINKATATINLSNLASTYDGTPKPIGVSTIPGGLTVTVTYDGASTVPTNAGSYAIAATVSAVNYQGSVTNTLVIDRATTSAAITSAPNSATFGQAVTFTATVTAGGLTPTGALTLTIDSVNINLSLNGNGQAVYVTNTLAVDTHAVSIQYGGATNFKTSNSTLIGGQVIVDTPITALSALNSSPTRINGTTIFTATATGSHITYQWDFGDGHSAAGAQTSHRYEQTGVYTASVTATNGSGAITTTTPVVIEGVKLFFPLIANNYVAAPDLVVQTLSATSNNVQVVIKNQGDAAVVDEFWVDVYINPTTVPTHVNQTWPLVGTQGLVWGVAADALSALKPGGVLTLTLTGPYFVPDLSAATWPLAAGTRLYAQVDSANPATTYGAVNESHEILGLAYNNMRGPVTLATRLNRPVFTQPKPGFLTQLPARP